MVDPTAKEIGSIIYNVGKAKMFNLLESQLEGQRLKAAKRIVEDILDGIVKATTGHLTRKAQPSNIEDIQETKQEVDQERASQDSL